MAAVTARVMGRDFGRLRRCKPHTARRMWPNFDRTYKLYGVERKYGILGRVGKKNTFVTELQCLPVWTEDDRLFPGVHSFRAAPEYTSETLPFELSRCMTVIFVVCGYGESP